MPRRLRLPSLLQHFKASALTLATLGVFATGTAAAHTVWLDDDAAQPGSYVVMYGGHEGRTERYDAGKLGAVAAVDAGGAAVAVARRDAADGVRLTPAAAVDVLTLAFDNGYWSRTAGGRSVNRPMNEIAGAAGGVHAIKFHKRIVRWGEAATRRYGQAFELVPVEAAAPRAGVPLRLRVLIDGRPAAGIRVAFGEEDTGPGSALSDADGIASVMPVPGLNRLWSGRRVALTGDPRATEQSTEYSLVFEAR